ncbi:unnamed protein product, partial [Medioppia subpectinata]
ANADPTIGLTPQHRPVWPLTAPKTPTVGLMATRIASVLKVFVNAIFKRTRSRPNATFRCIHCFASKTIRPVKRDSYCVRYLLSLRLLSIVCITRRRR